MEIAIERWEPAFAGNPLESQTVLVKALRMVRSRIRVRVRPLPVIVAVALLVTRRPSLSRWRSYFRGH